MGRLRAGLLVGLPRCAGWLVDSSTQGAGTYRRRWLAATGLIMSVVDLTSKPREAKAVGACYAADACVDMCPADIPSWCDYYFHFLHCIATQESDCYRDINFCPENLNYCYDSETGDGNPTGPFCTPNHVFCRFQ